MQWSSQSREAEPSHQKPQPHQWCQSWELQKTTGGFSPWKYRKWSPCANIGTCKVGNRCNLPMGPMDFIVAKRNKLEENIWWNSRSSSTNRDCLKPQTNKLPHYPHYPHYLPMSDGLAPVEPVALSFQLRLSTQLSTFALDPLDPLDQSPQKTGQSSPFPECTSSAPSLGTWWLGYSWRHPKDPKVSQVSQVSRGIRGIRGIRGSGRFKYFWQMAMFSSSTSSQGHDQRTQARNITLPASPTCGRKRAAHHAL